MLAICAVFVVTVVPAAIFRIATADWVLAVIDVVWAGSMAFLFVYTFRTRRTTLPATMMAWIFLALTLSAIHYTGLHQVNWLYPVILAMFFLLDVKQALLLSVLSVCWVIAQAYSEQPLEETTNLAKSLTTTIVLASAFSLFSRMEQSRLQHLAGVDALTGAGNRRAKIDKLQSLVSLYFRCHVNACILKVDIDQFSQVNDKHGRVLGDQVLFSLAQIIRNNTRPTDTLYRSGGAEFFVVAENTALGDATSLAVKLREIIGCTVFPGGTHLTVSIGVAKLAKLEGSQDWINRAERALTKAKAKGRNRVEVAAELNDDQVQPSS
ncbi:GGDEF domain-containing protein [Pseudohalioglobus lutimaris]|uniref:GGDEF domain-containing protein n=1 Tax=Pseudohalioglobus lutimaris TaxID=1737061 RepID=UPI00096BA09F|nr:GGDEF domain-containing protein [Pseudohalioglobus lutimaris]